MAIQYGDLPTWVASIETVGALGAALRQIGAERTRRLQHPAQAAGNHHSRSRAPYYSGMDPTIAGALIGGGAAVIGFVASAWQNSVNLRAARRAAIDQRLWEKRSAIYERLLDEANIHGTHPRRLLASLEKMHGQMHGYASNIVYDNYVRTLSWLASESAPGSARRPRAGRRGHKPRCRCNGGEAPAFCPV